MPLPLSENLSLNFCLSYLCSCLWQHLASGKQYAFLELETCHISHPEGANGPKHPHLLHRYHQMKVPDSGRQIVRMAGYLGVVRRCQAVEKVMVLEFCDGFD